MPERRGGGGGVVNGEHRGRDGLGELGIVIVYLAGEVNEVVAAEAS